MARSKRPRRKLKYRPNSFRKLKTSLGGNLFKPDKLACEKLFVSKGNRSWRENPHNKWRTRMKYSLCKRAHKKLYTAFKNSRQSIKTHNLSRPVSESGVLFAPRLKGMNVKNMAKLQSVEDSVHAWLDLNGWTDKNIAKAQKMKVKLMADQ